MSVYPTFFNGLPPIIFNPNDFASISYIPNLQTDSAIVTSNLLASNNNVIQIANSDGSTSTGATQQYVDDAILQLSNNLLGTDIPTQLNENLNTILEIDNFITDLKTNTDINTSNITTLQNQLSLDEVNITTNTNNISSNISDITNIKSRLTIDETNISSNSSAITNLQATKQDLLTFDLTPTSNSNNVVSSGNIKSYVDYGLASKMSSSNPTFTGVLTGSSIIDNGSFTASGNVSLGTNTSNFLTVNSNSIFNGTLILNNQDVNNRITNLETTKQNLLTFDLTPTTNSNNVISSGNIKSYVDTSISNLVSSAPSTLDTLNELSTALGNDPNFSTTITNLIGTNASTNNPTLYRYFISTKYI